MIENKELDKLMTVYNSLRDRQYAAYAKYAKRYGLTTNEMFVLYLLWFATKGCTQKEICETISVNKQTINAIVTRFYKQGYVIYENVKKDLRNKSIILTERGKNYAKNIVPPVVNAENLAIKELSTEKAAELVKLTNAFTENMERLIGAIEEK